MLYTLGLRDYSELEKMIQQFSKEEDVDVPDNIESFTYNDMLGITFKLVNATDYYQYDKSYNVYKDKTDDQKYMKNLIQNGEDIKIVGVVQPTESASATMLKTGIGYPATLTTHVIEQAKQVKLFKNNRKYKYCIFTGKEFSSKENNKLDMNSLFTVDAKMLQKAFTFDQSKLKFDMGNLDLSQLQLDTSTLPALDFNSIFKDMKINISQEQVNAMSQNIMTQFQQYVKDNGFTNPDEMNSYFMKYLQTESAQSLIQSEMTKLLQESGLTEQFQTQLQKQMQTIMAQYMSTITKSMQEQISAQMTKQMGSLAASMQDAIKIDASAFGKAIKMNMDTDELSELMMSLMTTETSSYDGNLKNLGYADFDKPSGINIYPKDFENKQKVIDILDNYNEDMKKVDEDKVISYTDYVGTLMSSVTDIINVISYVLIAFVAISLVVSSIMIGVITYISVLERKKEIGILRAIGASKKNISQVFNAETFIIGLLAGVLGIVITLILLIPSNMLIHEIAGNVDVSATLPVAGGVILIVLSVILTLIGGLIPSKKQAHESPVTALRTE